MSLFNRNAQTGSSGILAVIVLALLGVVGAGMVTHTSTEVKMAASYRDGIAAQYLAEAGARWGYQYLKVQLANSVSKDAILAATNSPTGKTYVNMGQGDKVVFGEGATRGTVNTTIKLDPKNPINTAKRAIVAIASVGSAKRQVILPVTLPSGGGVTQATQFAIFAGGAMSLYGDNIHVHVGPIGSGGPITGSPKNYTGEQYPNTGTSITFPVPTNLTTLSSGTIDRNTEIMANQKYYFDGDVFIDKQATFPNGGALIYASGKITVDEGAHVTNGVLYAQREIVVNDKAHITGAIVAKGSITMYGNTNIQITYDAATVRNVNLPATAAASALSPGKWTNN